MKGIVILAIFVAIAWVALSGGPITGVQEYDWNTGTYTCPAGSYADLSTDGRQICRQSR